MLQVPRLGTHSSRHVLAEPLAAYHAQLMRDQQRSGTEHPRVFKSAYSCANTPLVDEQWLQYSCTAVSGFSLFFRFIEAFCW